VSALWILLAACGTSAPSTTEQPPAPGYKRPPPYKRVPLAERMIPSVVAIGTIKRMGPPPGAWADYGWMAFYQQVDLEIEQRFYDPKHIPSTIQVSVLVLPDMPFSCTDPCVGAIRPDAVGHKVLIKASHQGSRIEPYASAESFVIDPTPADVAKAMESVPEDRL